MGPMEIWYYNLMDCEIETLQLPDRCRLFVILSDLIKESGLGFLQVEGLSTARNWWFVRRFGGVPMVRGLVLGRASCIIIALLSTVNLWFTIISTDRNPCPQVDRVR